MNSEVHPAVAALVLLLVAVALAIYTWGSGMAAGLGGPSELGTGPDGHHYVQIQNRLVEHDADGSYLRTHDLENFDVEVFLGGLGFFSNGDVLLRRGPDPRTFFDNLRAFQRQTNQNSLRPGTANSGLFRCSLEDLDCSRFGPPGIDFKAAFGVYIDWRSDDVYIADTTRHLVRKYSKDGNELANPAPGFKFPNQVYLHEGQLLVADTNNHVVRVVDSRTDSFGAILHSNHVVPAVAQAAKRRWPSHFARIGEEWWVNVMKTAMDQGGIYVFDDNWEYVRNVELPEQADPISILPAGDEVWVSDWNNDQVMRFTSAGRRLPDLESEGLDTILAASRLERQQYALYSYAGIGLVVLILLALMVRALAIGMNKHPGVDIASSDTGNSNESDEPLYLEPDARALRRMSLLIGAMAVLVVVSIGLSVSLLTMHEKLELGAPLLGPVAGLLAIVMIMAWVNRANHGTSIRIIGSTITLRDHGGRESSSPLREVRYDASSIATRDAVVFLGRPLARIYNADDIEEKLFPRLKQARKVSPLQMMRIHVQLWHPQGVITIVALLGIVIYGVAMLAGQA
jgi:hypothetical protein